MPTVGKSRTVHYVAWDLSNDVGATGDAANHTLRLLKDGTVAAPANAPAEANSTYLKGVYTLVLSAAEATNVVTIGGVSSTAGVTIYPITYTFETPEDAWDGLRANHAATGSFGEYALADVVMVDGVTATTYDVAISAADAASITVADIDSEGNAVPDDTRYANCVLEIVDGTGDGQTVVTAEKIGVRRFSVVAGTMPVTLDNTSKFVVIGSSSAISHGGTVQLDMTQPLGAPRTLDNVTDAQLNLLDALYAAIAMVGRDSIVGTSWTQQTPAGTTIRNKTLNRTSDPTAST